MNISKRKVIDMNYWLWVLLILALGIFWIWSIVDMFGKRLKNMNKAIWFVLFIVGGVITSVVWLFVRKAR